METIAIEAQNYDMNSPEIVETTILASEFEKIKRLENCLGGPGFARASLVERDRFWTKYYDDSLYKFEFLILNNYVRLIYICNDCPQFPNVTAEIEGDLLIM